MCALGDVAEMVAKYAPHQLEVLENGTMESQFANREHAEEFAEAVRVLVALYHGERE